MISASKAVDRDQIPFFDAILSGNATEGVSSFNRVTSLTSADNSPGPAGQTQRLPSFYMVGISDSIGSHQASNRYAIAISETGDGVSWFDGDRCRARLKGHQCRQG